MPSNTPTNGNDTFNFGTGSGNVAIDGLGGFDTLNVDYAAQTANYTGLQTASAGNVYPADDDSDDSIAFNNIEALNLKLGFGNDTFQVDGVATRAAIDGGAGTDIFVGDFSTATGAVATNLAAPGTHVIGGTGTTVSNFEAYAITGGSGNDTLGGGTGNDTLDGGSGNNFLNGGAGDDLFRSHGGADTILGGAGTNAWIGDYASVAASLAFTQTAPGYYTLAGLAGGRNASIQSVQQVRLTTGAGADSFSVATGGGVVNIDGGGGANALTIDYSSVKTNQEGAAGANAYAHLSSNDANGDAVAFKNITSLTVKLGSGADSFAFGGGALTLAGGAGVDTLLLHGPRAGYTVTTDSHNVTTLLDRFAGEAGTAVLTGVERLQFSDQTATLSGDTAPVAVADGPYVAAAGTPLSVDAAHGVLKNDSDPDGDSFVALLQAQAVHGSVTLNPDGGFTYTAVAGYSGADSFTYADRDSYGVLGNTVAATFSVCGPRVINGTAGADTLTGDDNGDQINGLGGHDSLYGGAGNDTLDGGAGFDSMSGGKGNDVYDVDASQDVVEEAVGEGSDTVYAAANWTATAGSQIERIVGSGTGSLFLTGNAFAMEIDGNASINVLNDAGASDTLAGGTGDDTYVVHNAATQVVEAASAGYDGVRTDLAAYILPANVETLTYTGAANFSGVGNALANAVTGGAGDDTLDGGAGAGSDRLAGGAGNDVYYTHATSDVVVEAAGGGYDTIYTTAAAYAAPANVEALVFIGTGGFTGYAASTGSAVMGGAGGDRLYGGMSADTLDGAGGNDTLSGGAGADTFVLHPNLAGVTRILDFTPGADHLQVDIAPGNIEVFLTAQDNYDQGDEGHPGPGQQYDFLYYDKAAGKLFEEGQFFSVENGQPMGGTNQLVATFDTHPDIHASDVVYA